uniref:LanC-like protein 3 homolog n=1 Tax=Clastoptera arizonana TaxID=38151 RepID=A0A1B6CNQ0_9HEMI
MINFAAKLGVIRLLRNLTETEIFTTLNLIGHSYQIRYKMSGRERYFLNSFPDYKSTNTSEIAQNEKFQSQLLEFVKKIEEKQQPKKEFTDGGIYVGIPGIAYMFLHLSKLPSFSNSKEEFLKKAFKYITVSDSHIKSNLTPKELGFLLGCDGVIAIAASIFNELGMKDQAGQKLEVYSSHANLYKPIDFLPKGGDELLVGRAGFVCGALWLKNIFGKNVIPNEDIVEICSSIYQSGRMYSKKHRSPCPLMYSYYDTEYLGAAHGLCGILLTLISCPNYLGQVKSNEITHIKDSVDFLLSLQTKTGNFPCAMDEIGVNLRSEHNELVHWCHGAPGVVYLMAKAYLVWKDEKYLESCLRCGDLVWKKGLLKKGPGICHGVAGNGYVFLLLYRLTGDQKHLYRAQKFGEFLFTDQMKLSRTPDCPYSLYEGIAGTVCFLGDLLHPDKASFPFIDIFE